MRITAFREAFFQSKKGNVAINAALFDRPDIKHRHKIRSMR
jgi:hypothetical protein